jgi:hypothetical protein
MDHSKIVNALLDLGVEGPAVAVDVLRAAGVELPVPQLVNVMNAVAVHAAMRAERNQQRNEPDHDPGA